MIDKIKAVDFIGRRIRTKFRLKYTETLRILVCKALKIVEKGLANPKQYCMIQSRSQAEM
jgi:hypothetical protein